MRTKQLLLVDAVSWTSEYPVGHRLRSVPGWFSSALEGTPDIELHTCHIENDLDRALDRDVHGVIVSGSPRGACENEEATENLMLFLRTCLMHRIPVLGVCYGHQVLARMLRGIVKPHPDGLQLANTEIELTPAGRACPLFKGMRTKFKAISGHADYVPELPPNCQLLAGSEHTNVQAFKFQNLLYGVQFHPEFTEEIIKFLWTPRVMQWKDKVSFDLPHRIDTMKDPSPTHTIIQNFAKYLAL
ncbi:MAG: type 1 glutamine amidotransferase [Verrucomicrobia bacterium]|jgi:GMP synthase-like glutamine amidotransferase|nr:type 1 glutamine amidotransferase [Verrucomicrobiota bacterium]